MPDRVKGEKGTSDLITGFMLGGLLTCIAMLLAVYLQVNYIDKNKPVAPIILQCPDNSKQIVIPNASKMEL
jgi:hypothetical protein